MPNFIKLRHTAQMSTQRVLATIKEGKDRITYVREKDGFINIKTACLENIPVGRLARDEQDFLSDLHGDIPPERLRVTGGGLILHGNGGDKIREVGDWIDLTDTEMQLVMESYYRLVPKLHGLNIDL